MRTTRWKRAALGGLAVVVSAGVVAAGARVGADDGDRTDAVKAAIQGGKARNVIYFLGDGMGDSRIGQVKLGGAVAVGHVPDRPTADRLTPRGLDHLVGSEEPGLDAHRQPPRIRQSGR